MSTNDDSDLHLVFAKLVFHRGQTPLAEVTRPSCYPNVNFPPLYEGAVVLARKMDLVCSTTVVLQTLIEVSKDGDTSRSSRGVAWKVD